MEPFRNLFRRLYSLILLSVIFPLGFNTARGEVPVNVNPLRVAVIIGDQWKDPACYLVEAPKPSGSFSGYAAVPEVNGDSDFHDLTVLLKSWCIPFDVIRLDQQILDRYMFLDMHGNSKYGTIIWDVNISDSLRTQDYSIITEMVKEHGTGLIAISDRVSQPEIQDLLGLKYKGSWESNSSLEIKNSHFINEKISTPFVIDSGIVAHIQRQQADLLEGTLPIVMQGPYAQVTAREYPSGGHVVWFGSDHNYMFSFQSMRTIFRKAITWTTGYNLYKTWANDIIMIMDDPGGASNNYLEHWHYPVLQEETIEKYLIAPLLKHKAVLNINFVPGFVNEGKRMLEPSWNNSFTDGFGTKQDYISSKKGYDKGVRQGVFEVMCHGLTHMQPDLVSDPGWYGTPNDGEKSEVGWYREFGDTRRKNEIPAAEQLWRMNTAIDWLTEQFGVVPLEFCPGGLGSSVSYFNNTAKIAGKAGFGWNGWESGYLGNDMVITGWKYFGTPECPLIVGAPPDFHDFGISRSPEIFATIFDKYPTKRFININEFIGYIHSGNSGKWSKENKSLSVTVDYDGHYCRYFETHESYWNFEYSDWMKKKAGTTPEIAVDGIVQKDSAEKIKIPRGAGKHVINITWGL